MNRDEFRFSCELLNGLHARPASYLVNRTQECDSEITLQNLRNQREANAKSVLSLIAADVCYHDTCNIIIEGGDVHSALRMIRQFVLNELPGCDNQLEEVSKKDKLPPSLSNTDLTACRGIATGHGLARGAPVCLKEYRFLPEEGHPVYAGVTGERLRLLGALKQVKQRIKSTISEVELVAEREILNAHLALASDPDFHSRLLDHVDNGLSVVESIEATLEHFSRVLAGGENSYLRDRVIDIRDLCDQLLRFSYGSGRLYSPDTLVQDSVCLADNLTPSQFLALDKRYLKGLVLQSGGKASHTVLLARAHDIPVVVGAEGAHKLMEKASHVVLDAKLGLIIADPNEQINRYYQQEYRKQVFLKDRCKPFIHSQGITRDGKRIEVAGNIMGVDDAKLAFTNGAESIGLFRTEMLFMERTQAPDENEQLTIYKNVVNHAKGRPVIIRTIDIGADKPVNYLNLGEEQNPFLGYRAVRLYPQFLKHFKTQLRAIYRAAVCGPVKLMVPMITTVDEVLWVHTVLSSVKADLIREKVVFGEAEFGIMLEVPSCVFIIDQLSQHIDFFSLGTNDLAQYFLATDRGNKRVGKLYSYLHPSFLRMLHKISSDSQDNNKWLGVCGEMAGDLKALPILVGLGINELSLPAGLIPEVKERLSHLNTNSCKELLQKAMACHSLSEVEHLLLKGGIETASYPVISTNLCVMNLDAITKEEVIKELVDILDIDGRLATSSHIEGAIWEREEAYSTGLGHGIAIPHCQSNDIYSDSIAIARLKKPVDWEAMDGEPVDLVFMLAVRKSGAQENHMKIFASLARKLVNDDFLGQLRACTSVDEMLVLLRLELEIG